MSSPAAPEPTGAILVVDDNRADLRLLVEILTAAGHTVRPMRDGRSALASAFVEPPQLVLADIQMSDLDGYELCRRLKADPRTAEVPVVFISAAGELLNKVRAFAVGGVDYITKPYQTEEVLARVGTHLALFQHRRQLEQLVAVRTAELQAANAQLQQEIVERLQAEATVRIANQQLAEANELLGIVFDGLSDGLALCDPRGTLLMVNQSLATLLGGTVERALRQPLRSFDEQCAELVAQTVAGKVGLSRRIERTQAAGHPLIIDAHTFPALNARGSVRHVILHLSDISERTQYQHLALQNERLAAMGRLSATIAHEVNTPLQSIQNLLFMLELDLGAEHSPTLRLVRDEIERVSTLIRRVLDLSRPAASTHELLDANTLLRRVLLLTASTLARHGIAVAQELGADLPPFPGRADHLTQVLLNLILNAVDATPRGGTLTLRTLRGLATLAPEATAVQAGNGHAEPDGGARPTQPLARNLVPTVVIQVSDSGSGIAPEILGRVFEPFFTTKSHGSGLGLAICRQIVEQHGGTIMAESRPGLGTTFSITIPVGVDQEPV